MNDVEAKREALGNLERQSEQARRFMIIISKRLRDAIIASGVPHHIVQDSVVIDLGHPSSESARKFIEHYGQTSVTAFKDLKILDDEAARKMLERLKTAYPSLTKLMKDPYNGCESALKKGK